MEGADIDRGELSDEERHLIAPCGIYCGACDLLLGNSRNLAREMHRILHGFNMADVGPFIMGIDHEKVLEFLNTLDKWGQGKRCPGCLLGGCTPFCSIRQCAHYRGFLTCAECDAMPCNQTEQMPSPRAALQYELVTRRYSTWNIRNLARIREIGYRRFVDEMREKVARGFLTSDVISREMVATDILSAMGDDSEVSKQ